MQPPTSAEETEGEVSDNITADCIRKCRPIKKKNAAKSTKPDAAKVDLVVIASETRSPGPNRGKCLYQSRKCENERAIKRNGKPHNLCEEHRSKQNQHQRKFDAKKFSRKRLRDSESDEDAKIDKQSHRNEEPSAGKHHRTIQEAETITPSNVTTSSAWSSIQRSFYSVTGSTTVTAPYIRLPSIQSPRGPILPSASAVLYSPLEFRAVAAPMTHNRQQTPHKSHQPFSQKQVLQPPTGYSHSELVAASVLAQPQRVAVSNPGYKREESPISGESRDQFMMTPRVLPSLLVPPSSALSPSPYYRASGMGASPSQRFVSAMAPASSISVSPARPSGNMLLPLVVFGLQRSPMSSSSVSKPLQK